MPRKAPPKREAAPLTIKLPANLKPPTGTTSGCYIRSLVMLGKPTDEILELVHKHFKGSTAKGSDVSWNRAKLRAAGKKMPEAKRAVAKPKRKRAKKKTDAPAAEPAADPESAAG